MIKPENETEDLLLSVTKNSETLIDQTHRKAEETLEFKLTKSRETFHFNPPIPIEGSWMLGLTSLEVYNSLFNIKEENNKFEQVDNFKSGIPAELKRVEYKDPELMVYRMELFYDEIVDILDVKYKAGSINGYTLPPGIFEITDINSMLKSLLPDDVKVKITIEDIRLRSNVTSNKTIFFLYNFKFYSIPIRTPR